MQRYVLDSIWNRDARNGTNNNFEFLFQAVGNMGDLVDGYKNELAEEYEGYKELLFTGIPQLNRTFAIGSVDNDGTIRYRTDYHIAILDKRVILPQGAEVGLYDYSKYNINLLPFNFETDEYYGGYGRREAPTIVSEEAYFHISPGKKNGENLTASDLSEMMDLLYVNFFPSSGGNDILIGKYFIPGSVDFDGTIRHRDEHHTAVMNEFIILDEGSAIGLTSYDKYNINAVMRDLDTDEPMGGVGRRESEIITSRKAKYMITPRKKDSTNFTQSELSEVFNLLYVEPSSNTRVANTNTFEKLGIVENVDYDFEPYEVSDFGGNEGNAEDVSVSEMYALYESLRSSKSDYITRYQFGESTNGVAMYAYEFKPVNHWEFKKTDIDREIPKIFITSGVHGHEKSPVFTVYNLMNLIVNHWRENELIEYLRFNVHFVIVPIVNPDGFNLHNRQTVNAVDINRDFPVDWIRVPSGYAQNGEEPLSQPETRALLDEMKKHSDAVLGIDYHNMTEQDGHITYTTTSPDNDYMKRWSQNTMLRCARDWQKQYASFPQDEDYEFGYTSTGINGSTSRMMSEEGIPGMTLEIAKTIQWEHPELYSDVVMNTGLRLLVEIIRDGIKTAGK